MEWKLSFIRFFKHFYGSIIISILVIIMCSYYSSNILETIYLVVILALLEISLSFDNAVVNAKVLSKMTPVWQLIFIWIGLPIAVFGMRLVFPILLVSITTHLSFINVIHFAMNNPNEYSKALNGALPIISAFSASFLLMVSLRFFLTNRSRVVWCNFIEESLFIKKISNIKGASLVIIMAIGILTTLLTEIYLSLGKNIAISFALGVIIHEILHITNLFLDSEKKDISSTFKAGLIGFLYLEVLDASFSFDGVIGAFAITTDIFIIMAGLGIGALFVRSMTIFFVKQKTLSKFVFLEHGAHYAIGVLGIIMLLKLIIHVPEWITGGLGISIITLSVLHSLKHNKKNNLHK